LLARRLGQISTKSSRTSLQDSWSVRTPTSRFLIGFVESRGDHHSCIPQLLQCAASKSPPALGRSYSGEFLSSSGACALLGRSCSGKPNDVGEIYNGLVRCQSEVSTIVLSKREYFPHPRTAGRVSNQHAAFSSVATAGVRTICVSRFSRYFRRRSCVEHFDFAASLNNKQLHSPKFAHLRSKISFGLGAPPIRGLSERLCWKRSGARPSMAGPCRSPDWIPYSRGSCVRLSNKTLLKPLYGNVGTRTRDPQHHVLGIRWLRAALPSTIKVSNLEA